MATTKKPGIVAKVKTALSRLFTSDDPARKSPQHVAAGRKAAVTTNAKQAVTATKKAAKKVVKVKAAKPRAKKARR